MKKQFLVVTILAFGSAISHAQVPGTQSNIRVSLPAAIFLTDINGKMQPANLDNREIKGSPFFTEKWTQCIIRLSDNRQFEKVPIRLNLQTQEVHYLSAKQEEMLAPEGIIREIQLEDTTETGIVSHTFLNGFPFIDNNDVYTYYDRLVNGNAQLLLFTRKKLMDLKTYGMAGSEKEYLGVDIYYVYKDGIIQSLKKDKRFIVNLLADKKEQVEQYIAANHLKCKSIPDIRQVLTYYNTL